MSNTRKDIKRHAGGVDKTRKVERKLMARVEAPGKEYFPFVWLI